MRRTRRRRVAPVPGAAAEGRAVAGGRRDIGGATGPAVLPVRIAFSIGVVATADGLDGVRPALKGGTP
jgi:hypothetical protein